jgi:hypothetical protein
MFVEGYVSYSMCKQKMTLFKGRASRVKMTSPGSKLTTLACYLTKKVNKVEELTCVSANIEQGFKSRHHCYYYDKELT